MSSGHGAKRTRRNGLLESVADPALIEFFYLDRDVEGLIEELSHVRFTFVPPSRDVPFTAQIRGYQGARDRKGDLWILKEVEDAEAYLYKQCELAYYLDFMLRTFSAPTLLVKIDGKRFRATKVVTGAVQIGSCNYLEEPYRRTLANDLINRWLMFDEDRNPNNYMVLHNSHGTPHVVAIDFNHADFISTEMKIVGTEKQFGWQRTEKTRFLTLLKPENFATYSLADFAERLESLAAIPEAKLKRVCASTFGPLANDVPGGVGRIVKNVLARRSYIDEYFRRWFPERDPSELARHDTEYEGLGKQFVEFYKKRI